MENEKKLDRPYKESRDMINRLSRIEGQVRGIKKMVENDAYCIDILMQVMAVGAALDSFNSALMSRHLKTCVAQDIREGKEESVDEFVKIVRKLMK